MEKDWNRIYNEMEGESKPIKHTIFQKVFKTKKFYFRLLKSCELWIFLIFYHPFKFCIGFEYNFFRITNNLFSFSILHSDSMDFDKHIYFKFGFEWYKKHIDIYLFVYEIHIYNLFSKDLSVNSWYVGLLPK